MWGQAVLLISKNIFMLPKKILRQQTSLCWRLH